MNSLIWNKQGGKLGTQVILAKQHIEMLTKQQEQQVENRFQVSS